MLFLFRVGSVLCAAVSCLGATNLVVNGGFEVPQAPVNSYSTFYASDVFDGWTVEFGAVNIHATNWYAPAFGLQSLDLNDSDRGAVFQEIETVRGERYRLRFALGANTQAVWDPSTGPAVKWMAVLWGTNVIGILKHDVTGRSPSDVGWQDYSFVVVGTGFDRLTFRSLTSGTAGPAIDQVSLTPMIDSVPLATGVTIRRVGDSVSVCWPTILNQSYQLQWADRVDADVWTYLGGTVVGNGDVECITNEMSAGAVRFFRVLEQ